MHAHFGQAPRSMVELLSCNDSHPLFRCQSLPVRVVTMMGGYAAGELGEEDAAEGVSDLNVAHFFLASLSPLNPQPAAKAVITVAMQKRIAMMVDVGASGVKSLMMMTSPTFTPSAPGSREAAARRAAARAAARAPRPTDAPAPVPVAASSGASPPPGGAADAGPIAEP